MKIDGLSKLEYAAIHNAAGLSGNREFIPTRDSHFENAAADCVRLAKALFEELEKDND